MFLTGIVIRFLGEANTNWSETKKVRDEQGKEHEETEQLTGHEEYFENSFYLVGGKSGPEITLPAGQQTYPFTCLLPTTLPSSYEGEFGHVRYTIKITLDRPWKFDQDAKIAFTVITPVDLNANPRVKVNSIIHFIFAYFSTIFSSFYLIVYHDRNHLNWNWKNHSVVVVVNLVHYRQLLHYQLRDMYRVNKFQ